MTTILYIILSVVVVSVVSFVGAITLVFKKEISEKIIFYLISFSVGAILGDVFLHLLPEVVEKSNSMENIFSLILLGFIIFFIFEKFIILWHHRLPIQHSHPLTYTILFGDSLHNFIDGAIIASSFLVSLPAGIATTIAIFFHEIPQELGNFSILIKSGLSARRALLWNFVSATGAIFGAILVLIIGAKIEAISFIVTSLTIGGFIYIAGSDLIPELNREHQKPKEAFAQLLALLAGIGIMVMV